MVRVLSELSTSYKEKTQLYCARALCNLACHHGSEKSLVEGGGVAALMMIALVRQGSTCDSTTYFLGNEEVLPREPSLHHVASIEVVHSKPQVVAASVVIVATAGEFLTELR